MIVRRATLPDLDGICAVADAVRLDPEHAQIGGFLVYMHGRQGYADRLAATDLFDVAIEDGVVVGFLFCESMGFDLRGTLRYEDGCLWGLYGRDVPREVPADQAPRVAAHGLPEA